ncbi:MAG TPA: YIP1 family protein [Steroidobacteraceae bacterium]|nr:YIP1 family protein [Steroidobacteraceae bacterium]
MIPTEPIRPLHDVWLRPRRVFRGLAEAPVGFVDQLLGAAQGVLVCLAWSRAEDAGKSNSIAQILGTSLLLGSIVGIAILYLMAAIYTRLGNRAGGHAAHNQVVHVLAYGGVPMATCLAVWVVTALLAGEVCFIQSPQPDVEGFVEILLHLQVTSYVLLGLWSIVLQVMGFSEILGFTPRKAFALWVLGQLIGALFALLLLVLRLLLLP